MFNLAQDPIHATGMGPTLCQGVRARYLAHEPKFEEKSFWICAVSVHFRGLVTHKVLGELFGVHKSWIGAVLRRDNLDVFYECVEKEQAVVGSEDAIISRAIGGKKHVTRESFLAAYPELVVFFDAGLGSALVA